jgi:hypothetical protein
VSAGSGHRALRPEPSSDSAEPLEPEQYWELLHDLLNQLTTTRLHAQHLLARLQNGDAPSDTDWRDGLTSIDHAALLAVGLIKGSFGAQVVKLRYLPGGRARTLGRRPK